MNEPTEPDTQRDDWNAIAADADYDPRLAAANARIASLRGALEECAAYLKAKGGPGAPYIIVAEALAALAAKCPHGAPDPLLARLEEMRDALDADLVSPAKTLAESEAYQKRWKDLLALRRVIAMIKQP